MQKRGQAVEYATLVGLVGLITVLGFYFFFSQASYQSDRANIQRVESIGDDIIKASEEVYYQPFSQRTLDVSFPKAAKELRQLDSKRIQITIGTSSGDTKLVYSSRNHVDVYVPTNINPSAISEIIVKNNDDYACITVPGETCPEPYCWDDDGDGFNFSRPGCGPTFDCDDTNASIYPGAVENCTNGVDDDCDGLIDGAQLSCIYNPVSACGTLTMDSVLTSDVSAPGTCFTIGADDVTLDCDGHKITYGTSGAILTYGVENNGFDGLTIKNCVVEESTVGLGGLNYNHAVYVHDGVVGFNLFDSEIYTHDEYTSNVEITGNVKDVEIIGNKIISSGNLSKCLHIWWNVNDTILENNYFEKKGSFSSAVYFTVNVSNISVFGNTINNSGFGGWAFSTSSGALGHNDNLKIKYNNMVTDSGSVLATSGRQTNTEIMFNNITATQNYGYIIRFYHHYTPYDLVLAENKIVGYANGILVEGWSFGTPLVDIDIYNNEIQAENGIYIKDIQGVEAFGNEINANETGVVFDDTWNNKVFDSLLLGNPLTDVRLEQDAYNNYLLNLTFDDTNIDVQSPGTINLSKQWYLDVLVTNNSNPVQGATVELRDINTNVVFSILTDATGRIPTQNVTEKVFYDGSTLTLTPHTLTVTKNTDTKVQTITVDDNLFETVELS